MVRSRASGVSNHDCQATRLRPGTRGHPSRRGRAAAPQDEGVGCLDSASGAIQHSLMVRSRASGVSNHDCQATRLRPGARGHPSRRGRAAALPDEGAGCLDSASGAIQHSLMMRSRASAVSNHDCQATRLRPGTRGHRSRRAQGRAPQDEGAGCLNSASGAIQHSLMVRSRASGVSNHDCQATRLRPGTRGYPSRRGRAAAPQDEGAGCLDSASGAIQHSLMVRSRASGVSNHDCQATRLRPGTRGHPSRRGRAAARMRVLDVWIEHQELYSTASW